MASISLVNVRRARYPHRAGRAVEGFPTETLTEVRSFVADEAPNATPLISAIDEVLEGEPRFLSDGNRARKLVAATGPVGSTAIEGLMYAEGHESDGRTFSMVNVSIWISRANAYIPKAEHLMNRSMTGARRIEIRNLFYNVGLGNWDEIHKERGVSSATIFWGLPVSSTTLITPIGNQEGDITVPFYYGDWRDVLAVSGLDISASLKTTVMNAVQGHHATNRMELEAASN